MAKWFALMRPAFGYSSLYGSNGKPVEVTVENLEKRLKDRLRRESFKEIGVNVDFFSISPLLRDENTVRFEISTGSGPGSRFIDGFNIQIGESRKVPERRYFRKSIEIFKPFEAYLSEFTNEQNLRWYERQQAQPGFPRPTIVRGFHYMDAEFAKSVGGVEHCLRMPAWRVERFCDGVLIELTETLFDNDNPEHLVVQRRAMEYLGIWEFDQPPRT